MFRIPTRILSRSYSASPSAGKVYKEKSFKDAWLMDTGAYPVMGVIVFAVIFCAAWGGKVLIYDPDARYTKHSRKTLFRGELKDAEHH